MRHHMGVVAAVAATVLVAGAAGGCGTAQGRTAVAEHTRTPRTGDSTAKARASAATEDPAGKPRSRRGGQERNSTAASNSGNGRQATSPTSPRGSTGAPAGNGSGKAEPAKPDKPEPLRLGSQGPRVRQLQRRLKELHYDPGAIDGVFGATTQYAVWAFQKVNDLPVDGVVGAKTRAALRHPEKPEPLIPNGPDERVEIDLSEQLLYVYQGGELALITHISSGSENPYCTSEGICGDAVTPTGNFEAIWRVNGWRESDLGRLYNPVYFAAGGFAVHGSGSVPLYPASHGCVRIPMHTANIFPDLVEPGEPFYVRE